MSIASELIGGFEQLAESLPKPDLKEVVDIAIDDAVAAERQRLTGILRAKLAVYKVGMAAGVLNELLAEFEGQPVNSKPVCSKHGLAGCAACKGAK